MKLIIILLLSFLLVSSTFYAENLQIEENNMQRMKWFKDAKLGIFIHWGVYAVNGIDESWSFYNNYIPYETYMQQANSFTAGEYNPDYWVELIKESGAKYAVLTSKHHDGVALWDTKLSDLNVITKTPAKRDLIQPFCDALRKKNLKVGLYYSLIDWSHPDYPNFTRTEKRYEEDKEKWNNFVKFYQGQMEEISNEFRPDLIWFDGDWERTSEQWKAKELKNKLLNLNPNVIVNSRLHEYGDYDTPEQGVPIIKPESEYWELCLTMNDSWGYQPYDTNYKSGNQIIRTFADCVSKGGNLLLDIGPKADGTIPDEQISILKELGRWNKKHYTAVFDSDAGIKSGHFPYPTTISKDKKTLYLFLEDKPIGPVIVKGLKSEVQNVNVVGNETELKWEAVNEEDNENLFIDVPESALDKQVTVLAVKLKDEISLSDIPETITVSDQIESFDATTKANVAIRRIIESISDGKGVPTQSCDKKITNDVERWKLKHFEALTNPEKGIPAGYFFGETSLNEGKDILFLYLTGKPTGPIAIKGIKNEINRIRIVGNGTKLTHKIFNKLFWSEVPGIIYIDVPHELMDEHVTVIAVQLKGEIDLHEEK